MSGALEIQLTTHLREYQLRVELAVAESERLAVVGPSGAGKTTLLRLVAGLRRGARGRIALGAEAWLDSTSAVDLAPERRRCGLLFQDYALFPAMRAWRNVAYGIGGSRRDRRRQALEAMERFGVAELAEARPEALSGGERQRVALARALAARPRALLLDEPLAALDPTTRKRSLRELHAALGELEIPVLLVTHSFDEAALLADRLAVLDRGTVVQAGSAAEITARPQSAFVADFAGAVVLRGTVAGEAGGLTVVRLDGGGEVRSVDAAEGEVAASVFPWEISLEPAGSAPPADSMLNRVEGEIASVTEIGNRVRVGMAAPQMLGMEVTASSAARMGLRPGLRVTAAWKATATRLIPL
jgi:ABC-type sulfate/molybdate transport systems ATPase subunit